MIGVRKKLEKRKCIEISGELDFWFLKIPQNIKKYLNY